MSSAPELRDQRLRLYKRLDKGSDGFTSPVFQLDVTRWGRLDERSAQSRHAQERLQMTVDAVAEFSDEVSPPRDGIIVDEAATSVGWWIRGFYEARATRRVIVGLDRIDGETFKTMVLHDSAGTLDGTHIVNPS